MSVDSTPRANPVRTIVVFPGQGIQSPAMGEPWSRHPVWALVKQAEDLVKRDLHTMLLDPRHPPASILESHLSGTLCSIMAWTLLKAVAVPVAVAGHSLGQVCALHAAGVLSFEEAITVVAARAGFAEEASRRVPGAMAAVMAPVRLAEECCAGTECWVANDNSPNQTVLSGTKDGIKAATRAASSRGVLDITLLDIDGGYHSPLMRPAAESFTGYLRGRRFRPAALPVVHNARTYLPGREAPWAQLLGADLVTPVRWRETQLELARAYRPDLFIQCGHGRVLTGLAKRTIPGIALRNASSPEAIAGIAAEVSAARAHALVDKGGA